MIPSYTKAFAVASLLLTSLLQGCDGGEGYSVPQLEAARHDCQHFTTTLWILQIKNRAKQAARSPVTQALVRQLC